MVNWYGSARSNYFRVKDSEAFKEALSRLGVDVYDGNGIHDGLVMICVSEGSDSGGWPTEGYDDEIGEGYDIDIETIVAEHLADGEVAVLMEVGAEKLRYLTGWAVAIHSSGSVERVSIDDIYQKARKAFGVDPTPAIY